MNNMVKFITLVKQNSFLYDPNDEDYKDRYKKERTWKTIANAMGVQNSAYWCAKWKSLRDNYNKHKKSELAQSGQIYHKYRNWPWAKLMRFIDDYSMKRSDLLSEPNTQDPLMPQENIENINNIDNTTNDDQNTLEEMQNTNDSDHNTEPMPTYKKPKRQNTKFKPKYKIQSVPISKSIKTVKTSFDEIDLFFLSYAKNLKRLTRKSQALIKLEIASLFTRFELNENNSEVTRIQAENVESVMSDGSEESFEAEDLNFKMEVCNGPNAQFSERS